jgi:hypothetical protein
MWDGVWDGMWDWCTYSLLLFHLCVLGLGCEVAESFAHNTGLTVGMSAFRCFIHYSVHSNPSAATDCRLDFVGQNGGAGLSGVVKRTGRS